MYLESAQLEQGGRVSSDPVIVEYESKSRHGVWYKTFIWPDGRVSCSCPGFTNQGKCWHADQQRAKRAETIDPVGDLL